jgi:hypothetical protein
MLQEKSPTDLKIMNRKTLLGLGANAKDTERFLNNSAFSLSQQTPRSAGNDWRLPDLRR